MIPPPGDPRGPFSPLTPPNRATPVTPVAPAVPQPPAGNSAAARSWATALPVPQQGQSLVNMGLVQGMTSEDIGGTGFLERAGRFVSSVLSPVQLPQDILFASLAGVMDKERGIMDYLGDLEWQNYTPWTRAPIRNVDGRRLLSMAGVEDEAALQWAGLGLDLFGDPLMGGAVLRGVAKVAKVPGLNKAADFMDTVAESTMLAGALPTVRVVQAARALPGFKAIETAVVDGFVRGYLVPVANAALKPVGGLPAITERSMRVGGTEFNLAGMFTVDGGRMPGAQDVTSRAGGLVEELRENTAVTLMAADAAAGGNAWRSMLTNYQQSLSVMYDIPIGPISNLPPEVSQAMLASAYSTAGDFGFTLGTGLGLPRRAPPAPSPRMRDAVADISEIEAVSGATRLNAQQARDISGRINHYKDERARIMGVAQTYGLDGNAVGNLYDEVVGRFQQISAVNGYFASGYGPLRDKFVGNMADRVSSIAASNPAFAAAVARYGGEARVVNESWRELLRAGARGEADTLLSGNVVFPFMKGAGAGSVFSYRDMFAEFGKIPDLDLGVFLNSLTLGHMRRTYGVFQDADSWKVAVDRLKDGRMMPNRMLNEPVVEQALTSGGFQHEFGMMKNYIDSVTPKMYQNRPTGAYVRQEDVLRHLMQNGISPERAQDFWRNVARAQDPQISALADRIETYGRLHGGTVDPTQVLSTPRQNLSRPELETLVELMSPVLSTAETARSSMTSARKTESLTGLMKLAQRQGLIIDSTEVGTGKAPRWWVSVNQKLAEAMPELAGKTVHPMVYREFANARMLGKNDPSFLGKLRSVVTAGYLASPATTVANVAGGFWTAAMYGISPVKLMSNMVEVYKDWKRLGPELPDLADMRDIVQSGIAQNDLIRLARDVPDGLARDLRSGVRIMSDALASGAQAYQEFLRRPGKVRASGALGLGMFEATESLFRLGTFRMVMKETGGNVEEARRAARFVVFDYSAQPGAVQLARNTGAFLFPAFPYFMVGRTATTAVKRPGMLAVAERVPGVVHQMVLPDEDERRAYLMGMQDWEREDKFIPIQRKDNGDVVGISFNQLIPTNTMTGAPFADSLKTIGLWGPLMDIGQALIGLGSPDAPNVDPGRGRFTGDFGRRVLPTGTRDYSDPETVLRGVASFFYNSFAPAIARKSFRAPEDFQQQAEGLVPKLMRLGETVPASMADPLRTNRELITGRADQDMFEAAVSFGIRSTRTTPTRGPIAAAPMVLKQATTSLNRELQSIDRKVNQLIGEGKMRQAEEERAKASRAVERYYQRWGDYITEIRRMAADGVFNPSPPR